MIQLMESGDKYATNKMDTLRTVASHTQMNSQDNNSSLEHLLTKLNIPINCLDNDHIRQHYLEEYSAKYSKAKYLLSNARKKQRKIIMTYYEEKEKQDNINELQIIKESLLEENEKIKKFKEALKDKLIIYQQRIQFLKDAEFWSVHEIEQLQNNSTKSIQTYPENLSNLSTTNDSLHLLQDYEQMKYSDNLIDDLCATISNDNLIDISSKSLEQLQTKFISEIDENIESLTTKTFQWLKNLYQVFFILISNLQFNRFQILSTILMITLTIFLVIFMNDLLEYFLIYLTKPSIPMTTLSPPNSTLKSLFRYLLSTIYNSTTSWLSPFFHLFKFSV